jgi:hypothetical protein
MKDALMNDLMNATLVAMNENKLLLAAVPAVGVGACLGYRVTMGAVGLGCKALSTVADVAGNRFLSSILSAGIDKLGDNFFSRATSDFTRELKVAVGLTALTITGLGASTLLVQPELSSWNKFTNFAGLTTPPTHLDRLKDFIIAAKPVCEQNLKKAAKWASVQLDYLAG